MKLEMRLLLYIVILIIITQALCKKEKNNEWQRYKKHYRRTFNEKENTRRFNIFQERKKKITEHNRRWKKGEFSFRVNFNRFSDMQESRVRKLMNGLRIDKEQLNNRNPYYGFSKPLGAAPEQLPETVDWREKQTISPVRDQGPCASCWSFSTIGAIEAQLALKKGKLTQFSTQHLIDCSSSYGNFGCQGGQPDNAFQFIQTKGLVLEETYPYNATQGQCQKSKSTTMDIRIAGHRQLPSGDEYALQKAVSTVGPVCAAIDASRWTFHAYAGGVYNDPECSSQNLDHSVLIVGYGRENGSDYWIVKNSWGPNWGEKGYVKMSRNCKNQCGIASLASYPIV